MVLYMSLSVFGRCKAHFLLLEVVDCVIVLEEHVAEQPVCGARVTEERARGSLRATGVHVGRCQHQSAAVDGLTLLLEERAFWQCELFSAHRERQVRHLGVDLIIAAFAI